MIKKNRYVESNNEKSYDDLLEENFRLQNQIKLLKEENRQLLVKLEEEFTKKINMGVIQPENQGISTMELDALIVNEENLDFDIGMKTDMNLMDLIGKVSNEDEDNILDFDF